ncbi:MAG: hypothetical protein M3Y87_00180 [Myxococcota bacterium]|nr:hypothetical protein [Myxococcota bacterium]
MHSSRLSSGGALALTLTLTFFALGATSTASAQATLIGGLGGPAGFGTDSLAPNDDGSSTVISLAGAFPTGLNFFGTTQTNIYVNNNGNVTFAGPVGAFTPTAFPVAAQPMIAPWWGDVDTRDRTLPAEQNLAYWHVSPGRFVATWHNVGYYSSHVDLYNNFQVILTDASAMGAAGDFDVELRYNRCQWTTGDASGGVGGLGGTPAQAGFDAGNGVDFYELPGSRTAAILLLCTTSNVGETGVWRFQVRSGGVAVCGNGVRELGEGCDDGGLTNGDGCNQFCEVELPPGGACTLDTDCLSGFCTDGVCCNERCSGQCERCNRPGALGACGAQTGAPFGTRTACVGTGTTCGGSCSGTLRTACTYPGAATACDDGAFCSVGDACNAAGGCTSGGPRDCADALGCTTDACDESGDACTSVLASGCLIASMCVPAGALDPSNACMACQPAISGIAYTPLAAGTTCDDAMFCTVADACDGAGACGGGARDCSDAIDCTTDACDEATSMCTHTTGTSCVIGGACVAEGTRDPANDCLACQPAIDASAYTALASGTGCDDGAFCTDVDACDGAGACAGAARDCGDGLECTTDACDEDADACTTTLASGCQIDGACVAEGATDPADPCRRCDPTMSTDAYVAWPEGPGCTDAGMPDGGMPDAGTDAGTDAGEDDASVGIDAMPGWEVRGSGACSASGGRSGGSPLAFFAVLALGLAVLARRRHSGGR